MSQRQRKILADIARTHDLVIIEDAAYAYLAHRPPPPVAVFARNVLYINGFSKNVATGLRVGVVICPDAYRGALQRAVRATSWNTPSIMTTLVCNWIQDGSVARFEMLKRRDARQRQSVLREALGDIAYIAHPGSYFAWLPLRMRPGPTGWSKICWIKILPFQRLNHSVPHKRCLRLSGWRLVR
jgi:DNA-binding transcriptional MocR family regulator